MPENKIGISSLIASTILVTMSAPAEAAIGTDFDPVLVEPIAEIFLSVHDSETGASYTRDLGVNLVFVDLGNSAFSYAPDALYIATFGASKSANLRYSVNGLALDAFGEQKVWTTRSSGEVSFFTDADVTLQAIQVGLGAYISAVNDSIPSSDISANLSTVITNPSSSGHYTNPATFNESLASSVLFTTGAPVGVPMKFYSIAYVPSTQQSSIIESTNAWTLAADGTLTFDPAPVGDTDSDGIADVSDNCSATTNPAQVDSDGDGFGNACDTDLNDDCITNVIDLGLFRSAFFSPDADADFNVDGVVNTIDLGIFRAGFLREPGPSGLASCE